MATKGISKSTMVSKATIVYKVTVAAMLPRSLGMEENCIENQSPQRTVVLGKKKTEMDGPIRFSSLTLKRKERLLWE
jgi:hypothetical protein